MAQDSIPFATSLKRQRRAIDLTHEELAGRIDCSPATLHKIQIGQRRSSQEILDEAAAAARMEGRRLPIEQAIAEVPGEKP